MLCYTFLMLTFRSVIGICWAIFILYWILNWGNAKSTAKREYGSVYIRLFGTLILILTIIIFRTFHLGSLGLVVISGFVGLIGSVLAVCGLIVAILARRALGSNWSPNIELKEHHTLTTTGIYGVVRHPIYLGMFLMAVGSLIVFESIPVLLIILSVFSVFIFRIKREEKLMMETFPKDYPEYKKKVKALIPFVW
jgi:protein-S-isoprenylcysteine O-methyltransferase Ste14